MASELRVQLVEDGPHAQRFDVLSGFLRQELLQLDVEAVTPLLAGEPPPDFRAFELATVDGLLLTLGHSSDGLRPVVPAIRTWLARVETRRTAELEIGGDALELSRATAAHQQRLIDPFVSSHATRDGT